ncbi:MAG: glutamate synthase subunit beta [Bacteroidota bacterium]
MGHPKGFLQYDRQLPASRPPQERVKDFDELYQAFRLEDSQQQAARCMDCGVPFCHSGCPLGNNIPEFNDAAYRGEWAKAYEILSSTNNFPEFTGRICPAPCEGACVLGIHQDPIAIEHIEKTIIEEAWSRGLVKPRPPRRRSGKEIAVIGSGPAGLAAAAQLNAAGHLVTVFERDAHPGGLLRYGIPDFKLDKQYVERRIQLMRQEGIQFQTNTEVGKDISVADLKQQFDGIVLCGGSTVPRDLPIPGRELKGIHYAMDFLGQQNRLVSGEWTDGNVQVCITAEGKHVVVIGGGDTGADCVGTSNRQQAASVTQLELLGKPPLGRAGDNPWPEWPLILRTSTSHEEGCEREWSVLTEAFLGDANGDLRALQTVDVRWGSNGLEKIAGSEREIPCELALLAVGFLHPEPDSMLAQLGVALDERGNVQTENYHTSIEGVFAAGDMRRGQSLVVWAIAEGREVARAVDAFLMGDSQLPSPDLALIAL